MSSTSEQHDQHADRVLRLRAAGCVFAEDEAALLAAEAPTPAALEQMITRRIAGTPLEQVLGWAEFCGLRIVVEPGVFVPRRRTEFLVAQAVAEAPENPVVVDLGCGSGAIGMVVASAVRRLELHAADVDPAAVRCARRNLDQVGGRVYEGDLYAALPGELFGRVDVIAANAPYVPSDAVAMMPPEARDHEPRVALDGGSDGLDIARRVVAGASGWLAPRGRVLVETSERQAPLLADAMAQAWLEPRIVHCDELDATVVIGTSVSAPPASAR